MSQYYGQVISLILQERFGNTVQTVGNYLFDYGGSSLFQLRKYTLLPLSKIKESLAILLKYSMVTAKLMHTTYIYTLQNNKVFLTLRYPRYIKLLKKKFGVEAEILMEEILQKGYMSDTMLTETISERLKKIDKSISTTLLNDKISSLKIAKYLVEYAPAELVKPDGKKDDVTVVQYWTVNFDRFHQDMRDELIAASFETKFDSNLGELVRLFIQQMYLRTEPWAETSNPIPVLEVRDLVRKMNTFPQLVTFFDQYLTVLDQDNCRFILKVGEAAGGSYQLCIKDIFTVFAWEICEQVVLEKFDSKAARIFRLIKNKPHIEQEQIQKLAMIPAKEAKLISYQLLEENFIHIQELKKAPTGSNSGPSKSFVLFHIQLKTLVRTVLDMCYKSLFNVMTRRMHSRFLNKRIIDKKQRIDTILISMKMQGAEEEQLADISDMLTPPEREVLEKIENNLKKINILELEIDQTVLFLELYLQYQ